MDKFMKVAAISPAIRLADPVHNAIIIEGEVRKAAAKGAGLIVLPELALTGATCGDLFLQPDLLAQAERTLFSLCRRLADVEAMVVLGLPIWANHQLCNVAAVFGGGKIAGIVVKQHPEPPFQVPAKGFDWEGHLLDSPQVFCGEMGPSLIFGVEIGTDLLQPIPPSTHLAAIGANIIINPAATFDFIGKEDYRRLMVQGQALRHDLVYIYANAGPGESTTDQIFTGHSLIVSSGKILAEGKASLTSNTIMAEIPLQRKPDGDHGEDYLKLVAGRYNWDGDTGPTQPIGKTPFIQGEGDLVTAMELQSTGLAQRLQTSGAKAAVIGISGGLDSALALLVTCHAYKKLRWPVEDIVAITMPGFGTTTGTRHNAHRLCEALGIPCQELDITQSVGQHLYDLDHPDNQTDVVFENAQARMRTMILMNKANQKNGLVIGTGSMSELALGWATYNGDHMSMYAVNGGVPKTLVRHMVESYAQQTANLKLKKVLEEILATKVSPELLPAQNDQITQITEDMVGPYILHDFFLYYGIGRRMSVASVYRLACHAFQADYTPREIAGWLRTFYRRFIAQQFKRSCLPDGPQVVDFSLSPRAGLHIPTDASFAAWEKEITEL